MIKLLPLLLFVSSCSLVIADPTANCDQGTAKRASYAVPQFKWTEDYVSVCWENPQARFTNEMARVENSIDVAWDQYIRMDFLWMDRCGPSDDVHIVIDDVRPNSNVGEPRADRKPSVVYLNFEMSNWGCATKLRDDCIAYEANHEFGHVLGLLHEQDRPDAPKDLTCEYTGETDPSFVEIGPYDPSSIMNYCSNTAWPDCEDIDTIQQIYN